MITISDVRKALGEAYSTYPDDATIQNFIDKRSEELLEITGLNDLSSANHQSFLRKWLLNMVCVDVLQYDLLGKDSADALDYSLGDLKESKDRNVQLKLQWIEIMKETAKNALEMYFVRTVRYRAVSP